MTERKPPGLSFESWVDQQIREAQERGDFENLPGFGKPLPDEDKPYDELWWVKQKLATEGLSILPPTLALRKEAEDALAAAADAPSESEVRRIVSDINDKISACLRGPVEGPPLNLAPYDIGAIVEDWRLRHPAKSADTAASGPSTPPPARDSHKWGLLQRLRRRGRRRP
ncbi:hypothetical protein ABH940_006080 [Streptacidiphilus sp. BW17]